VTTATRVENFTIPKTPSDNTTTHIIRSCTVNIITTKQQRSDNNGNEPQGIGVTTEESKAYTVGQFLIS